MRTPLVDTKLKIPPAQRELVARPRLIERLNRGLDGKLILVSAPAGYGKTLLLSAWAHQSPLPVAWISLDAGDNDLARFLAYLIAALEKINPAIGVHAGPWMQALHPTALDPLLASIVNDAAQIEQRFALVLDDYHLIHEKAIHHAVSSLLAHLPPQMSLVIAGRADPPLPLARLRARSELVELRMADLCFTPEEAARFFHDTMDLDLTPAQVAALTERTEGWIAGLQLAALSLREAGDRSERIRSFSGSNRFILDYLIEEVLAGQPEETVSFLIQTSVLERLTGSLCDAVTGFANSQEILESLVRDNLFIVPLDQERAWFRYHPLFLDLLRKRAQQCCPEDLAAWHRRAGEWFERRGEPEGVIQHALAAGEFERAAQWIESAAQPFLMRSQIYTFQQWIRQLPEPVLRAHPNLVLFHTWTEALTDAPAEEIERRLSWIPDDSPETTSRKGIIQGYLLAVQGETVPSSYLLQKSLADLPPEDGLFRSIANYLLSLVDVMSGRFNTGAQMLEQVMRTSLEKGQVLLAAGALCTLAEIHWRRGQLQAAREDYERTLEIAVDARGQRLPVAARALMGLGELWREWNDLDQAEAFCQEGIELSAQLRQGAAIPGLITLAWARQARGDDAGATAAIQKAWETARLTQVTGVDDLYVETYWAGLKLRQGDLAGVAHWIEERGLTPAYNPDDLDEKEDFYKYHVLKYDLLVFSRWLMAQHQPGQALAVLEPLSARMEAQGRVHLLIEALLLSALAHHQQGRLAQAQDHLRRALAMAESGGFVRRFLDEGPALRPLLQMVQAGPTCAGYARRLLAALDAETAPGSLPHPQPLPEPLTDREIELLGLIAAGLSNQEIAQRLYISLPTVKWHTTNIFGKLGVRSRTQAVAQARALGLLPGG